MNRPHNAIPSLTWSLIALALAGCGDKHSDSDRKVWNSEKGIVWITGPGKGPELEPLEKQIASIVEKQGFVRVVKPKIEGIDFGDTKFWYQLEINDRDSVYVEFGAKPQRRYFGYKIHAISWADHETTMQKVELISEILESWWEEEAEPALSSK